MKKKIEHKNDMKQVAQSFENKLAFLCNKPIHDTVTSIGFLHYDTTLLAMAMKELRQVLSCLCNLKNQVGIPLVKMYKYISSNMM